MKTLSILVLNGYGLRIAVERGHLLVEDGLAANRRRLQFSRLDRDLKRILILGHAGTISLDAIRWLNGVGVPLTHLDSDGRVFFVSAPTGAVIPALRRNQALAVETGLGGRISEGLVRRKIEGQTHLLPRLPGGKAAAPMLQEVLERLGTTRSLQGPAGPRSGRRQGLLDGMAGAPGPLHPDDAKRRPAHWRSFGTRISALSGVPRKAVNPANAMLNYLYALLEAEARIAALAGRGRPHAGADAHGHPEPGLAGVRPHGARPASGRCLPARSPQHTGVHEGHLLRRPRRELPAAPAPDHGAGHPHQALGPSRPPRGPASGQGASWRPIEPTRPLSGSGRWMGGVLPSTPLAARAIIIRPRRGQRPVGREFTKGDVPDRSPQRSPEAGAKRRSAMREVLRADRAWTRTHTETPDLAFYRGGSLAGDSEG